MYKYTNVDQFLKDFKSNKINFPIKRLYYKDSQIKEMFNKLKKVKYEDRIFVKYFNIHNIKINTNNLLFLNQPRILI